MNNEIWRVNSEWLFAYTDDKDVMKQIKRSYPDFEVVAKYFKDGELLALQYKIPSKRKRAARHVFSVKLSA